MVQASHKTPSGLLSAALFPARPAGTRPRGRLGGALEGLYLTAGFGDISECPKMSWGVWAGRQDSGLTRSACCHHDTYQGKQDDDNIYF